VRLAVYTDYAYHRQDGRVYAERAFALFLAELATRIDRAVVIGRLSPEPSRARYDLGDVDFVPLPFYRTLAEPLSALRAMAGSLRGLWRGLDEVDAVWVIGPHLLALPFALFALVRRRRLVLGVRQEYPQYVRNRHPARRSWHWFARLLEGGFRLLGRVSAVIAVGPRIAEHYRHSRRLLQIAVSVTPEREILTLEAASERDYGGELRLLSVGRLDSEKNPLLLADALALLRRSDPRWRLVVCGEGALESSLAKRLEELGVAGAAELLGYVPHERLAEVYRSSHVLAHVSLTEGLPQVLFEAFAAGLPVVATDVGGIAGFAGTAVRLVPPGDVAAIASAADEIATDPGERGRLVAAGLETVRRHTLEREAARVAAFIAEP
jgi:glycosyltransferase involved in cell wall biosynthesis